MRDPEKWRIRSEKLHISQIKKSKNSIGSPDPFGLFGLGPHELPDIPEDPPLPVIRPPRNRLALTRRRRTNSQDQGQATPTGPGSEATPRQRTTPSSSPTR